MSRMKLLGWSVFAAGLAAAAQWSQLATLEPAAGSGPQPVASEKVTFTSQDRLASLPERELPGKPMGQLFSSHSWTPPSPPPSSSPAVPSASAKPSAPAPPYRVAGQIIRGEEVRVVLARGDRVFAASEGEAVEGAYLVEAIGSEKIILLYLPLGTRVTLLRPSPLDAQASPEGTVAAATSGEPAFSESPALPPAIAQALRGPTRNRSTP